VSLTSGLSGIAHPWEVAWREGRWQPPSEILSSVVEFARDLKRVGAKIVLDLGAGSGRHSIYLASQGFQVVAIDVSETSLTRLNDKSKANRNITIVRHEMDKLPFIPGYFDGVVCTHVIHHGTVEEITRTVHEIYRVVSNGGLVFLIVLSDSDPRIGKGLFLEPNTWVVQAGDERGISHHFFSKEELTKLLGSFEIMSLSEKQTQSGPEIHKHFHATLRKPFSH
jgi:ubiquinone/menaquinone biosynthesis C-methylase UbiE